MRAATDGWPVASLHGPVLPMQYEKVLSFIDCKLDGWLARRFGWSSPLGAILDPLADKVLIGSLAVGFLLKGDLSCTHRMMHRSV